jgi:hypothetical protein
MPASTFTFFHDTKEQIAKGVHNVGTDTFKTVLSNTAPTVASDDELADITQIAASGGYTAGAGGGYATTLSVSEASGTASVVATDLTITAAGGSVGPFRYAIIYNDTSTGDKLLGYLDYGSSITLADTEQLVIDFGTSLYTMA